MKRGSRWIGMVVGSGMLLGGFVTAEEKKAPSASYIGAAKCKMCHKQQFESWGKTPHAKSFEALEKATPEQVAEMAEKLGVKVEGKASESPECLKCHVTGLGEPGGYTAEKGKKDMLDSVSCEICHGPGGVHLKAKKEEKSKTILAKPGADFCVTCHTKETDPEFDYEKYLKKGVHESFKAKK